MFDRLRGLFSRQNNSSPGYPDRIPALTPEEKSNIGTERDPLRGYEAAVERHETAMRADASGDPDTAIRLYEKSVADSFVGSHPYEALATLYERRHDHQSALQTTEAYVELARSGRMPRGAQRSADRKLPEFEARAKRHRSLM